MWQPLCLKATSRQMCVHLQPPYNTDHGGTWNVEPFILYRTNIPHVPKISNFDGKCGSSLNDTDLKHNTIMPMMWR
jgi:hypothetical protein